MRRWRISRHHPRMIELGVLQCIGSEWEDPEWIEYDGKKILEAVI